MSKGFRSADETQALSDQAISETIGEILAKDREQAEHAAEVRAHGGYGMVKHLVFVGPDGRKAFEVAGVAWDFDRLDALCREAGIQLGGSYDDLIGAFKLNSRVPGTISWGQQLLWGGALIVVIIVLVILLVGPTQR